MNGRIYDPLVGRMMSADPIVPDALNPQAWNRYSYVGNDPLTFTDPSGHSWLSSFFRGVTNFFKAVLANPIVKAIAQIVLTVVLTPVGATIAVAAMAAAASSAIVTGLSGGNLGQMLKAGAIAGAMAFASFGVGEATAHTQAFGTTEYFTNVAGHAGVGCVSSVASGGNCGEGALSGAVGAAAGPLVQKTFPNARTDTGEYFGGLALTSAAGGLASVAGGGKFENGAITAAFGYMYNACGGRNGCLKAGLATGAAVGAYSGLAVTAGTGGLGAPVGFAIAGIDTLIGGAIGAISDIIGDAWTRGVYNNESPEVIVVDSKGNAIPLGPGETVEGSPDGRWIQVKDSNGKQTGTRIDGGHQSHSDPRAQQPHGHVKGLTNPDGTPWLSIR